MKKYLLIMFVVLAVVLVPRNSRASSFGETATTVLVGAGVGAVLGTSTLPFYGEPGEHTSNIFVGAAIGAVLSVAFVAVNALGDDNEYNFEDEYEEAEKTDFSLNSLQPPNMGKSVVSRPKIIRPALARVGSEVLIWTPIQQFTF